MNDILKNIRKNNIIKALKLFLPTAIFTSILCFVIYSLVIGEEEFNFGSFIMVLSMALFVLFFMKAFIRSLILIIKPIKDDVFKKYGSPQKIKKILDEIEKTKLYEDKHLVISEKYISDKKDYSKIVLCTDVIGIHKLVHSLNGRIDYYKIVIIDKYNETITYQYGEKEENLVDQLLVVIGSKCPNAELGYNKKEWEHIKKNSIKLPKEIKEDECFKCDNCSAIVSEDAFECPNCGEIFEDNQVDNTNDKSIDKIYQKAEKYQEDGIYDEAARMYLSYIEETEKLMKKNDKKCYTFNNCVEFAIAINQDLVLDQCVDMNYKTSNAYLYLGVFAYEVKQFDDSIKYLNKSLKLNPCNVNSYFELAENYKTKGELKKFYDINNKCYKIIYHINQLARYYRNLGYYYIEKEEYDLAKALYLYSLKYDDNPVVDKELKYIVLKSNNKTFPNKDELTSILRKNNIPTFIKKENLKIIKDLLNDFEKSDHSNSNVIVFLKDLLNDNSNEK